MAVHVHCVTVLRVVVIRTVRMETVAEKPHVTVTANRVHGLAHKMNVHYQQIVTAKRAIIAILQPVPMSRTQTVQVLVTAP